MTLAIHNNETRIEFILRMSSYLVILLGVTARLAAFLYNRSLWLDEAFLASSVIQRNLFGLFSELDYNQGAPVGFLCIVKSLVMIFGPSEYTLRFLSLISGFGSIYLFYLVLKIIFQDPRPWVGTAFFSTIPILITYSIEFKPYMFDGFLTLATLLIVYFAKNRTIPTWISPVYCAIAIWFSFPVIFTIISICAVWLFQTYHLKNKKDIHQIIEIGLASAISFTVFYFSLYHNLDKNQQEGCWAVMRIPILPHSFKDFSILNVAAWEYLGVFNRLSRILILLLTLASLFFVSFLKRTVFAKLFLTEAILIIIASAIGRYAIMARLLLFFIPIHVLFVTIILRILNKKYMKFAVWLYFVFVFINISACKFIAPSYVYRPVSEINPLIEYLKKSDKSIPIYLFTYAIPNYEYKTGYTNELHDLPTIPFKKKGVIYGTKYFDFLFKEAYSWESDINPTELKNNVDAIIQHKRIYLLFANCNDLKKDTLLGALSKYGTINEVLASFDTHLLFFEKGKTKEHINQ
jgi:4-amino-4-deoxy-L-arabinose transferase-like glycosyltransferase